MATTLAPNPPTRTARRTRWAARRRLSDRIAHLLLLASPDRLHETLGRSGSGSVRRGRTLGPLPDPGLCPAFLED
ncbi:MAG: hypothetical protein QM820_10555 [Minicystis sp.]